MSNQATDSQGGNQEKSISNQTKIKIHMGVNNSTLFLQLSFIKVITKARNLT